jgi:hypothetical protein
MNDDLFEAFLKEDCDRHARGVILEALRRVPYRSGEIEFTFNRFNVRIDFSRNEVLVDDELDPGDGSCTIRFELFRSRVEGVSFS